MAFQKWITLQSDERDCGACCISSIVKYYHGYVPLEIIQEDCHISKEGITAYDLIQALHKYGLEATGRKDIDLSLIKLPAILHLLLPNGLYHYVVFYGFHNDKALLMDPSRGKVLLPISELKTIWTGVVIEVSAIQEVICYEKKSHLKDLFLEFYYKYKKLLWILLIISILLNILLILSGTYTQVVLEYQESFTLISVFFLLLFLFKMGIEFLRNKLTVQVTSSLERHFTFPFLKHILSLPLKRFIMKSDGEMMKRIQEFTSIKDLFYEILVNGILLGIELIFSFMILSFMHIGISISYLGIILLFVFFFFIQKQKFLRIVDDSLYADTEYQNHLTECLHGVSTWKHLNSSYFISRMEQIVSKMQQEKISIMRYTNCMEWIQKYYLEITLFGFYFYTLYIYTQGGFTLYQVLLIQVLLGYIMSSFQGLLTLLPRYFYVARTFSKISEFLDLEEESLGKDEFLKVGVIDFKDVGFSYNQRDYFLKHVSFQIREGDHILIRGKSGVGKSTLCKLLYRLYEPSQGEITFHGIPYTKYSLASIRNQILYVSQEDILFQDTVWNNLVLGENYSKEEVNSILELCCAKEFVYQLPLGLNTPLSEGGLNLSGGQRQRLILARAILQMKQVILLDEALSQVDFETEKIILQNLFLKYSKETIIYVSHRDFSELFHQTIDLS